MVWLQANQKMVYRRIVRLPERRTEGGYQFATKARNRNHKDPWMERGVQQYLVLSQVRDTLQPAVLGAENTSVAWLVLFGAKTRQRGVSKVNSSQDGITHQLNDVTKTVMQWWLAKV